MSLAEESLSKKLLCLDDNVGINKSHIYGMTTIFYVVSQFVKPKSTPLYK